MINAWRLVFITYLPTVYFLLIKGNESEEITFETLSGSLMARKEGTEVVFEEDYYIHQMQNDVHGSSWCPWPLVIGE